MPELPGNRQQKGLIVEHHETPNEVQGRYMRWKQEQEQKSNKPGASDDAITVESFQNGIIIRMGGGQLRFHPAEAFEVLTLLVRHFIIRGTLSRASLLSVFEEQRERLPPEQRPY
jgi:hypothetical protein